MALRVFRILLYGNLLPFLRRKSWNSDKPTFIATEGCLFLEQSAIRARLLLAVRETFLFDFCCVSCEQACVSYERYSPQQRTMLLSGKRCFLREFLMRFSVSDTDREWYWSVNRSTLQPCHFAALSLTSQAFVLASMLLNCLLTWLHTVENNSREQQRFLRLSLVSSTICELTCTSRNK